jgi:hypothetical protein
MDDMTRETADELDALELIDRQVASISDKEIGARLQHTLAEHQTGIRLVYDRCMSDEPRRTTVTLIPKAQEALDRTADRLGLSKTDVMNRALTAYAFLEEEWSAGAKILVRHGDDTKEVRFL